MGCSGCGHKYARLRSNPAPAGDTSKGLMRRAPIRTWKYKTPVQPQQTPKVQEPVAVPTTTPTVETEKKEG